MVKEIILEDKQTRVYKDKYALRFRVGKKEDGYYFVDGEDKRFGPYEKAFLDASQMDVFVCGFKEGEVDVFRSAFSNLEKESMQVTSCEMARTIMRLRIDREKSNFSDCKFLGEVDYYRLIKEEENAKFFAKRDGYRRQLVHDKEKHIFQTNDGRVFCVDPSNVLPFEKYQLFDSFQEMQVAENMKGFDFSALQHNKHLADFLNIIKFGRKLPNKWCLFLLNQLKNEVGFDEYKKLSEPVSVKFTQHKMFLMEELIEAIKKSDLATLEGFIKEFGGENSRLPIIPAAIKEIESLITTVPSFVRCYTVDIDYKDKHTTVSIPNDQKIAEALNNPELYDWQGASKFHEEKPEGYEMVRIMQEVRCRNFLPTRFLLDDGDVMYSE